MFKYKNISFIIENVIVLAIIRYISARLHVLAHLPCEIRKKRYSVNSPKLFDKKYSFKRI